MDPITIGLLGGSALSSIGGLFAQNSANESAKEATQNALKEYLSIHVPDPQQQKLELEHYASTGTLSPQLEHAIKSDPSAFDQIVKNQQYSGAQSRALQQLQDLGEEGGLNLSDKANLQEQLSVGANKDKANRDAITDEMARRGQLGSGLNLQAQLAGAQSAGDRDSRARLQALGGAQDRALQSIMGAGDLAGKLQSQDYQQKSDVASARDRINQFNTTNAQNVQQRNVAANNAAQTYNLDKSQHLADANVDLGNKEQQYNKELQQKKFDNDMAIASGKANAYTGQANQAQKSGAQTAQQFSAFGSTLAGAGAQIQSDARQDQSQNKWDEWLKEAKKQKNGVAYGGDPNTFFTGVV